MDDISCIRGVLKLRKRMATEVVRRTQAAKRGSKDHNVAGLGHFECLSGEVVVQGCLVNSGPGEGGDELCTGFRERGPGQVQVGDQHRLRGMVR